VKKGGKEKDACNGEKTKTRYSIEKNLRRSKGGKKTFFTGQPELPMMEKKKLTDRGGKQDARRQKKEGAGKENANITEAT